MIKLNSLFGNNGSIPSIGGVPSLQAALAGVQRAEQALAAARALARSAAKREGKGVRGLFEGSQFILRATGERWCDQSRSAGEKAMVDIFARTLDMDAADPDSPFHFLAKRLIRPGAMDAQRAEFASADTVAERILAAARRAKSSGADERPLPPADSVAGRILAAGARAKTPTGGHKDD
jgi:hypothetical protein